MKNVVPSHGEAPATEPGAEQMIADATMARVNAAVWAVSPTADANAAPPE